MGLTARRPEAAGPKERDYSAILRVNFLTEHFPPSNGPNMPYNKCKLLNNFLKLCLNHEKFLVFAVLRLTVRILLRFLQFFCTSASPHLQLLEGLLSGL